METNIKTLFSSNDGEILMPLKKGKTFDFTCDDYKNKRLRLFMAGETAIFYGFKTEPDSTSLYYAITDALDSVHATESQYCLNLTRTTRVGYSFGVYKKIRFNPSVSYISLNLFNGKLKMSIGCQAQELAFYDGGYLRFIANVYGKKEGISDKSPALPVIQKLIIDIKEGTYGYTVLDGETDIEPSKIAFIGVLIEGEKYTGQVYLEAPYLSVDGERNLLPEFTTPVTNHDGYEWTAYNLSKKEWPKFKFKLNGQEFFNGEIFERCHRQSEFEIDLPDELIKKDNQLEICLISDYHDALPYRIHKIKMIETERADVVVVSVPEIAHVGRNASIIVETFNDGQKVEVEYLSDAVTGKQTYTFDKKGLNVIDVNCLKTDVNAKINIKFDDNIISATISEIIEHTDDGIVTGTGDAVYVAQDEDEIRNFLKWYYSERIGNLLTIRPVYRWASTRVYNEKAMQELVEFLNKTRTYYVNMIDGREISGCNCNPTPEEMSGEYYLGNQYHERDGQFVYFANWEASRLFDEQRTDLFQAVYDKYPNRTPIQYSNKCYVYENGRVFTNRSSRIPKDYKVAYEYFVERAKLFSSVATRHTGPTVLGKDFLQAGFKWIGAETMYSSMELQIAFYRSIAKLTDGKTFGVHHAMQWCTTPHDNVSHYKRYRLALYVSYILGAHEINTEEGLWHIEEYFAHHDRFSVACVEHTKQQQDFYRYVLTHTRRGEFHTPMAIVSGKYDSYNGFINVNPWGFDGPYGNAEKSWDLLKPFYPLSSIIGDCLYYHDVEDKPLGYYTGTPKGNIDVITAIDFDKLSKGYKVTAFLGYNYGDKSVFEKIKQYVSNGGVFITSRAHYTVTTDYKKVYSGDLEFDKDISLWYADDCVFTESTYGGKPVKVIKNIHTPDNVLAYTDDGIPLLVEYYEGNGKVVMLNSNAYPYDTAIRDIYENVLISEFDKASNSEDVWLTADEKVGFAVYKYGEQCYDVYALAVDWYNGDVNRSVKLRIKNDEYVLNVKFGVMLKCVVNGSTGAYCDSEDAEILQIDGDKLHVQGRDKQTFTVLKNGTVTKYEVDFDKNNNQILQL